jgi:hypothetical protein
MPQGPLAARRSKLLVAASAAIAALAAAPAAGAQEQQPPETPAIQQYVEAVPTGGGSSVPGVTTKKRTPLPPSAEDALKQASPSTSGALEEVATSSEYGAPDAPARSTPVAGRGPDVVPPDTSASTAVWRSIGAVGTASDARLLGLVAVLLAITVGAGALAVRRTRP